MMVTATLTTPTESVHFHVSTRYRLCLPPWPVTLCYRTRFLPVLLFLLLHSQSAWCCNVDILHKSSSRIHVIHYKSLLLKPTHLPWPRGRRNRLKARPSTGHRTPPPSSSPATEHLLPPPHRPQNTSSSPATEHLLPPPHRPQNTSFLLLTGHRTPPPHRPQNTSSLLLTGHRTPPPSSSPATEHLLPPPHSQFNIHPVWQKARVKTRSASVSLDGKQWVSTCAVWTLPPRSIP